MVSFTLLGLLAGCNSSSSLSDTAPQGQASDLRQGASVNSVVVQATCPQIFMRDATASHRVYARGGDGDPTKLVYQAAFADTTRSCTTDGNQMTINVLAQGRIVAGPAGSASTVSLPVRITVTETNAMQLEEQIYSQLVSYPAAIPADSLSGQFLFQKPDVTIPASSAQNAKVYIGFDSGPAPRNARN
ncbi:hypothetical protein NOF55_15740 [Rhizobiaceae bacterium BDR2-2]|uniref:Lipoprotein n=1 Tax=Ectorhizobium quercum TaxID=2965071 RepID=A0AAE3N2N2_9HYPH|nr:hypothetical protein [Ectorhizobium quercum]MCX8996397.1 hypothetical protein [Ectorhizobium quercum]MCX8998564.1 hypothetical protein [Ectorhizobium quercum]